MVVDYSKWDHFGDDDDDEEKALKRVEPKELVEPSEWTALVADQWKYEWFVDCHRLRLNDYKTLGELRGANDPSATSTLLFKEVLLFANLAVKHKVVPQKWLWSEFLQKAILVIDLVTAEQVDHKFPDAFPPTAMSMRVTAEIIYKSAIGPLDKPSQAETDLMNIYNLIFDKGGPRNAFLQVPDTIRPLVDDVGGLEVWMDFDASLSRSFADRSSCG